MCSPNETELREFVEQDLLIGIPEIVTAVESLSKLIQDLTDAMNRLSDKL